MQFKANSLQIAGCLLFFCLAPHFRKANSESAKIHDVNHPYKYNFWFKFMRL